MKITARVVLGALATATTLSATAATAHADGLSSGVGDTASSVVRDAVCPSQSIAKGLIAVPLGKLAGEGVSQVCGGYKDNQSNLLSQVSNETGPLSGSLPI